ncbi:MAG TPA: tetratricopeptide repeat protein, partial [Candidatus Wujingus californicus]|nr:tetratricopeptide repeat protein [Candidatus Brocadiales bacterium]
MTKNLVSPFKALMLMAVLASIGTYGCSKIDMPDEIISAYQKAIKINPELAEAHYNLGIAYSNHVMPDEAITEL